MHSRFWLVKADIYILTLDLEVRFRLLRTRFVLCKLPDNYFNTLDVKSVSALIVHSTSENVLKTKAFVTYFISSS